MLSTPASPVEIFELKCDFIAKEFQPSNYIPVQKDHFDPLLCFDVKDLLKIQQKFKFCSDGDCPLWALAGLHAISSLPAPLFQKLLDQIIEEQSEDGIMEILKDTNLSSRDECARAAAVVRWTLKSAWSSKCEGSQLTRDLLVLGVPRSHAVAISEVADGGRQAYEANAKDNAFMVNRVVDVAISDAPEGVVNSVKLSLHTDDVFTGEQKQNDVILNKIQIPAMLEELKKAYKKIEELGTE